VLFFVPVAWCVITVVAWFAILFSGVYPAALYAIAAACAAVSAFCFRKAHRSTR